MLSESLVYSTLYFHSGADVFTEMCIVKRKYMPLYDYIDLLSEVPHANDSFIFFHGDWEGNIYSKKLVHVWLIASFCTAFLIDN